MKLTPVQERTLAKLSETEGRSAYEIGESLGTLNALSLKGLVFAHRGGLGSCFSPRTSFMFYLKPKDD